MLVFKCTRRVECVHLRAFQTLKWTNGLISEVSGYLLPLLLVP